VFAAASTDNQNLHRNFGWRIVNQPLRGESIFPNGSLGYTAAVPTGLFKIVSGGQTGADRAALDWALVNDVPCGGWCPLGRWAEDGVIDVRYPVQETTEQNPAQRTEWNVRDSDGTLIVSLTKRLVGGTRLTEDLTKRLAKPRLVLSKGDGELAEQAEALWQFIASNNISVLNVAGPRASGEPGIAPHVTALLDAALGQVGRGQN